MKGEEKLVASEFDASASWIKGYLSKQDLKDIEQKIADVETLTAGEIVLLITRRSFDWGVQFPVVMLTGLMIFMIFFEESLKSWIDSQFIFASQWGELGLKAMIVIAIALLSYALSKTSIVLRMTTPGLIRREMAEARAELEFFRSGIKATKDATGILLFLAIEDRQAVVLADESISSKLPPETWDEILKEILRGIKSNKARDGILQAVEMSGALLKEHFPIKPGDINELRNHVIIKD